MRVNQFAIQMYCNDAIKDTCMVIEENKLIYEGQLKFLRHASDNDEDMSFTNKVIKKLEMYCADTNTVSKNLYSSDYIAIIHI